MTTNQDQTIYVTENKQKFVPEIGKECLFNTGGDSEYQPCFIAAYHAKTGRPIVDHMQINKSLSHAPECWKFKPLKTEAEIKRDKAVAEMKSVFDKTVCLPQDVIFETLHDEGYIRPREITDEDLDAAASNYSNLTELLFKEGARWAEKHIKGEA